jgi:hypothetical protein
MGNKLYNFSKIIRLNYNINKIIYSYEFIKSFIIFTFIGILVLISFNPRMTVGRESFPNLLLHESFDSLNSVALHGGTYKGITIVPGKVGKGVLIQGDNTLAYPAANHFNFSKGTMEFWVKPTWDGGTTTSRWFFNIKYNNHQSLDIWLGHAADANGGTSQNLFFVQFTDHGDNSRRTFLAGVPIPVMQWKPGEWHKVIIYWDFTLPDDPAAGHQSYLVYRTDDKFSDCVWVAPVGLEAPSADARISLSKANYPLNAVISELKIYDTSLLPVVPFPAFQFNPQKPETEANFRKLFANDGFASPFKTYNDSPNDCPKLADAVYPEKKVLFFKTPAFERVYENRVPQAAEIGTNFNYQVPPGEFETLFFNVYSRIPLNQVVVNYTGFTGARGSIPQKNLDLRVVQNWFQAGTGVAADQLPHYVPELLLHNDLIRYELDPHLSFSNIPSIPLLDHVETKIAPNTTRQFALIIKVPEDTPAGNYTSTITLQAGGIPAQIVNLNLEVLPFSLVDSGKRLTIFHSTSPSYLYAHRNPAYRWEIFAKELQDIRNHGFNGLILCTSNDGMEFPTMKEFEVRKKKVEMARAAGFKWLVLEQVFNPAKFTQEITPAYKDLLVQNGFEPFFSSLYEPNLNDANVVRNYLTIAHLIHSIGAKVVGGGGRFIYDRLNNPHDPIYNAFPLATPEPFDWGVYFAYSPGKAAQYWVDIMRGKRSKDPNVIETSYFSAQDENPQWNRYLCGYFLWVTGFDGCSPHAYQAVAGTNWYNDFAFRPYADKSFRPRPGPLAYPSKEGPVPTFQWEATREGIKDLKYLATWKFYKDRTAKVNPALSRQSETIVNELLEHYKDRDNTWNPAFFRVSLAQYEADRQTIINEIKKLYKY